MVKRLLIGTTNLAKLAEVRDALQEEDQKEDVEILSLKDFPRIQKVEETGDTFAENAVLKAKGYFAQTGIPTIADDGGLVIDALGGLPGVHSHRWLGHEVTDQEFAEAVLEKMKGMPYEKRTARLGGVMAFYDGKDLLTSENWIEGYISETLLTPIQPGFPYRSILFIGALQKPYGLFTEEEHIRYNHRFKNIAALRPAILARLF